MCTIAVNISLFFIKAEVGEKEGERGEAAGVKGVAKKWKKQEERQEGEKYKV